MSARHDDTMVETFTRATQPGWIAPRAGGLSHVFTTLLFAVLSLFLLIALLVGTKVYRSTNDVRTNSDEMRLSLSLMANSIRMNDATDAVGVADGPEGLALVLTESLDNGTFETRLYAWQGFIMQEYVRAGQPFAPDKARALTKSERFDFTYEQGLLSIHTDQGSTAVALRSVRGGA